MTVTYPLTVPTLGVRSSSFSLEKVAAINVSPFTRSQQVINRQGAQWLGRITLSPKNYADTGEIKAFLTSLNGVVGTFLYGDPDFLARGLFGVGGGSPLVDGASQTGKSLDIKNAPLSTTGFLLKGDYFQIGTGLNAELKQVVEDVDTDGAGLATIVFEPKIRTSPADSSAIVTTGAKGLFRLSENTAEWGSNQSSVTEITMVFQEAIRE